MNHQNHVHDGTKKEIRQGERDTILVWRESPF
jgi:hypothetical protein